MPSKNVLKKYIEKSYYHIYNRGVEKRKIFVDEQDYHVFLSYLKLYLLPKEESIRELGLNNFEIKNKEKIISEIYVLNNFFEKIHLLSFVLMPNHFHLELWQQSKNDIEFFMRSLITKYSKYFNKKYDRVGPLFQGRYKAVLVQSTEYLLYLSKYIHLNPLELLSKDQLLEEYPWSSYPSYLSINNFCWLNKELIYKNFSENNKYSPQKYKIFVESSHKETEDVRDILGLSL